MFSYRGIKFQFYLITVTLARLRSFESDSRYCALRDTSKRNEFSARVQTNSNNARMLNNPFPSFGTNRIENNRKEDKKSGTKTKKRKKESTGARTPFDSIAAVLTELDESRHEERKDLPKRVVRLSRQLK